MGATLKLDWATHDAAKYAARHWHYSRSLPCGKLVKVGAWERGRFVGVVVFAYGAQRHLGRMFGLRMTECVELCRVALAAHETPVTRIVSIALRMLKRLCPGLRAVVSYADCDHDHHGGASSPPMGFIPPSASLSSPYGIRTGKQVDPPFLTHRTPKTPCA